MTSDLRLVSIGLPVRNESARLADCVQCVLQQSYPNIEICISDNASSDDTYELANQLAEKHGNIRVRRHEQNVGPLQNFDSVRCMAKGHYFMWLAADDRIDPTYVEKMVRELDSHLAAVVAHSATLRVGSAGQTLTEVRFSDRFNPNMQGLLRQALNVLTPFKTARERKLSLYVYGLYRKAALDDIFESVSNPLYFGDRVLPALAAASGGQRYVDEFLFHKRVHDLSHGKRNPGDTTFTVRDQNRKISNLVLWFARCRTIPFWRRWYGLVIALPFVFDRIQNWLKAAGMPPLVKTKFKF
jgi:glycosyltransferase involved in cell wall biosynthesis